MTQLLYRGPSIEVLHEQYAKREHIDTRVIQGCRPAE